MGAVLVTLMAVMVVVVAMAPVGIGLVARMAVDLAEGMEDMVEVNLVEAMVATVELV